MTNVTTIWFLVLMNCSRIHLLTDSFKLIIITIDFLSIPLICSQWQSIPTLFCSFRARYVLAGFQTLSMNFRPLMLC